MNLYTYSFDTTSVKIVAKSKNKADQFYKESLDKSRIKYSIVDGEFLINWLDTSNEKVRVMYSEIQEGVISYVSY